MSEPSIAFITVTKLDAAKRQLRTAIELWFNEGDPVSVHSLLYASHEIIHRLFRDAGHKGLLFDLDPEETLPKDTDATSEELDRLRKEFPKYLHTAANFFKHANRQGEKDDEPYVFSPNVNEEFIQTCLVGLARLGEPADAVMRTFKFWYFIHRPEDFEKAGMKTPSAKTVQEWKIAKPEFFRRYMAGLRQRGVL